EVGQKPSFNFTARDYVGLAGGLIDTERAARVSGSRFGYLLGDLVLLEFALVRLALEKLAPHGFIPVVPPVLIKSEPMRDMGKTKFIEDGDAFYVKEDDLYLVGTAEDTIGPLHMGEVLPGDSLPRRYVGFSTAFRREAGSYGKDTRGIFRTHQFDKVEMFSFAKPEDSVAENDFLLQRQEEIVQALDLPYRTVKICTGEMGFTATNQYDLEVWLPSEKRYRETHSCSNTTDFQSRGLNIKYRNSEGGTDYVHMLNATGIAIGRTILVLLENHQTKDGNIKIPKVLQAYVGKKEIKGGLLP
ncbi:MAG: serine--tRNA ligase, partial [Candidatus Colwellbacteria bacterium RBG_13_48_8]